MNNPRRYVSRAGLKLEHALRESPALGSKIDPSGLECADLGCNVGGFTDCLLQHGAAKVYAVDTGYGVLDWKLRNDPRVTVMERTNALHLRERSPGLKVDLVTIDLGWTPQRLAVPAALAILRPAGSIISLIKPHYELTDAERRTLLHDGALGEADAQFVLDRTLDELRALGINVIAHTPSPIRGGKSNRRSKRGGNVEYLALLRPAENPPVTASES